MLTDHRQRFGPQCGCVQGRRRSQNGHHVFPERPAQLRSGRGQLGIPIALALRTVDARHSARHRQTTSP